MDRRMSRAHLPMAAIAAVTLTFAAAGCGAAQSNAPAPASRSAGHVATPAPTRGAAPGGAAVTVARSPYGRILMTGKHFALYSFSADSRGHSNCHGACAQAWPPLLTKGRPAARGAARGAVLGTIRRGDGSLQVTYRGHPLYRYIRDVKPREVLCQGVDEYGGLWTVVSPGGSPIQ